MFGYDRFVERITVRSIVLAILIVCLLLVAGPSFAAPGDCSSCHGTNVSASHHQSELYTQGLCNQCHEGVTTNGDCATCHTFVPQQNGHHDTATATSGNCAECHTNVGDLVDCLGCHQGKIRSPHHLAAEDNPRTPATGDPIDCAACHTTMEPLTGCSAASCHPADLRNTHHATPDATSGNCAECHTSLPQVVDCETCHDTDYWSKPDANGNPTQVDSLGNPLDARGKHHASANVQICQSCHTGVTPVPGCDAAMCHDSASWEAGTPRAQHHDVVAGKNALECSDCHSSVTAIGGCSSTACHGDGVWFTPMQNIHHDTVTKITYGYGCLDCHRDTSLPPVEADCEICHVDFVNFKPVSGIHHATTSYAVNNCATCHVGIDSISGTSLDCATCHQGQTPQDGKAAMHHATNTATLGNCADCHASVQAVELDCATCHAAQQGTLDGSVNMHHNVALLGQLKDCAGCHEGAALADNDCSVCHLADGKPPIADTHHATATAQTGLCSACHLGAEPVGIACADCHGDQGADAEPIGHHLRPEYQNDNCQFCHTDITLNGSNCESCHTSGGVTIQETHHATPLNNVGGDCSVCHQSVSSPDVCANCHSSVPHHNTLAANYGLCESCHSWPADKNENPQQGSCRQCHGESMHGKNSAAPIHDYRACFDCHGSGGSMGAFYPNAAIPPVFHARPSRGVGLTNPAPGKGTFNLFYSSLGGKGRNEDRFGEREDWENLREGREYSTPGVSYSLVQISEGGQTYQVPAFGNIPAPDLGGGTPPGGGTGGTGLEVCISCHGDNGSKVSCDNLKWRDHKTLNRVDLATYQLAESTYLGSYCPDLPDEPMNLALNKLASASDDEGSSYRASRAVDGDDGTRWYVRSYRTEWLKVDLGQRYNISKVVIDWHNEYAREYDVEISTDNRNWTRVYRNENGNGGTDTVNFSARDARYVRVECNRRRDRGYSIYELEVYQ